MCVGTFGAACPQPRFLATRSSSLLGLAGVHFLVEFQRASLEKLALEASEAAAAKVGEGKKESKDKHDTTLPKNLPSYLGTFSSKGQPVMMSACSTFDHSARQEPASPGFPVLISMVFTTSYKGWSRIYARVS